MASIAFRIDDNIKRQLEGLAKLKGINLSALIKLYITKKMNKDLNEITENGMTVAEELELLAMREEGGNGKVYNSAEEYIEYLKSLDD